MFDPKEDNRVRYQVASTDGHVESFFLKLNDPKTQKALWLRFTILSPQKHPKDAVAELWGIAFDGEGNNHIAAKRSWPFQDSLASLQSYPISLGKSVLEPGYTEGFLQKAGQTIEWKLHFTPQSPPMHLFPYESMYTLPIPRSKTLTPYPDAVFSGMYRVNGQEFQVKDWPGMQGHNWGRENANLYAWSHCNVLYDENQKPLSNTYFEGLSARIKMAGKLTPFMSVAWLRLHGVDLAFTKVRTILQSKVKVETNTRYRWVFTFLGPNGSLFGEIESPKHNLVGLYYLNPNSEMTYCLNSKIANLTLSFRPKKGEEIRLFSNAAALEIGTRDPSHGVPMSL